MLVTVYSVYLWENAQNTSLLYPNSHGVRLVDSKLSTQPHNSEIINDLKDKKAEN